jgi:hypothetical protein
VFGAAVALTYGALVHAHVVFGLFFGLTIVTAARGAYLCAAALLAKRSESPRALTVPLTVGRSEV